MHDHDFHRYAIEYIEAIEQETGIPFDRHFAGQSIADAFHLEITQAVAAILRTEMTLGKRVEAGTRVRFDLKELEQVSPPVGDDNLFVTFTTSDTDTLDGDPMAFGLHLTPKEDAYQVLKNRIFQPGEPLAECFSVMVYTVSVNGEMGVSTTQMLIGLNPEGTLVAYRLSGLGLSNQTVSVQSQSSEQLLFLLFLVLSAFMLVNQREAPLVMNGDSKAEIR